MLTKYAVLAAAAAAAVTAAPVVEKRAAAGQADIDAVILNYALTLEHLENAFYRDSLATYDAAAFRAAGYPDWATKECTYNFGVTDVKSFIATSVLLEGIGESAYLGAAQNITNPSTLTAAGSILTVESRHKGYLGQVLRPVRCPSTNPALPVKAFPAATISGDVCGGKQVTINGDGVQPGQYAAFLAGLQVYYAQIGDGNTVTVPEAVGYGRIYAVVSRVGDSIADDNIVAGPAVIDIDLTAAKAAEIYSQQQ
ncbi:hypothetical protein NDA13_006175 [Ustilago tritici]|nr:hypothetical protein NDA13_006175 [Ustilago tritici]